MAFLHSPPSMNGAIKRKRSWQTLPVIIVTLATLFGLRQIASDYLGDLDAHLPVDEPWRGPSKDEELLLEAQVMRKVLLGQGSLPKELQSMIEQHQQTLQQVDTSGSQSRYKLDRDTIVNQMKTLVAEKIRATDEQFQKEILSLKSENAKLRAQFVSHLVEAPTWKSLKDLTKFSIFGFLSDIPDRGDTMGEPQLHEFPSAASQGRVLCFLGNITTNGTRNFYTYAWPEALPREHILLNGTTLISETGYDFNNPWHSMYNLVQFVHWKWKNGCARADRVLLYHWSELRRVMGPWITQVFTAAGLPEAPYQMEVGDRPVCFQKAIVSRTGIGGVPGSELQKIFSQVRCLVRQHCQVPLSSFERSEGQRVRITLMVRSRTRAWKNQTEWEEVIAQECGRIEGCEWRPMYVANLTFCEQVNIMGQTDVLVSVHGAQLTNMIFMSPGGRLLEMFPRGWLELAGGGQYIYRGLADWIGLRHEGYWRDLDHAECPTPDNKAKCMTHYKDLNVGINATHVSSWLRGVVNDFNDIQAEMRKPESEQTRPPVERDSGRCACEVQNRREKESIP